MKILLFCMRGISPHVVGAEIGQSKDKMPYGGGRSIGRVVKEMDVF